MSPTSHTSPTQATSDEFGRIETRGIDYVLPGERHGRPRELFAIWAAANVNYIYILLGGLLMVFGLNVWQGLLVVVVGNLFWAAVGLLAISGPVSGTPSSVITRSMFGVRGNRVFVGMFSWPIFIAYEAINLAVGALAGFAFAEELGFSANRPVQILVVVVTAIVTLAISVYGHATILRMSGFFTVVLTLSMLVLAVYVVANADWGYAAPPRLAPTGSLLLATMIAGVTIIASAPLSWGISADYARYLPADASRFGVALWTGLGGFVPAVALGALGVLAGSAVNMVDPQRTLAQILPGWFYPVFLLVIVLGSMTNNVLTMYSSGLCLQAVGIPLRRAVTVFIDGVLGVALAGYALFISDFTDALSNILELTVALLGPSVAIYAIDVVLRRNRYDGLELHDETPRGAFWFSGGVNWAGFAALLVGTAAAALCLNTTKYVGPIASRLDGADLSSVVGPVVAIVVYVAVVKALYPAHFAPPARTAAAPKAELVA